MKLQIYLFQKKSVNIDKVNILKYSEIVVYDKKPTWLTKSIQKSY